MTNKIAKPVLKNKSWLIFEDGHKIGTVRAVDRQFLVRFNNNQQELVPSVDTVKNRFNVEFLKYQQHTNNTTIVSDYPTDGPVFNPVYNLLLRIPMYTKKRRSRCWYGAGYYAVEMDGQWRVAHCPKVIHLTRNSFFGPFTTQEAAEAAI